MSEQYSLKAELVPQNYNKSMLYMNIFGKNYICVSRHHVHVEPQKTSNQVYIGPQWNAVVFPDGAPLMLAKDYVQFLNKAEQLYGGVKALFEQAQEDSLKIYVEHRHVVPFFLYFLVQIDQVFGLTDEMLRTILKKTNERFWIWDGQRLGMTLAIYKAFKIKIGEIPEKHMVVSDDLMKLPLEYLLLFYAHGKVSKLDLLTKMEELKSYFVGLSVAHAVRSGKETILNDKRVLKSYNGTDIETIDDVIPVLEQDELLNKLFVEQIDTKNIEWIEQNVDAIKNLFALIKTHDLDTQDPFPGAEEFDRLYDLFYGDDPEAVLDELLGPGGFNLHELKFFQEYHNKVNTTLINYVSGKLSGVGQGG